MSLMTFAAHAADWAAQTATLAAAHADHAATAVAHAAPVADGGLAGQAGDGAMLLAQADQAAQPGAMPNYSELVQQVQQEEQLGWLTSIGKHFIGMFQKGGEVFVGFVTGIIPTLVVLMTAFYAVTELVGEQRVHGLAQAAGRIALTRYTVLPILAVFFLTNPMAYTFGTFLEEKHKPAFYDSAVSFVHPILGLFPHANAGEYFVWGGVLVALLELEKAGVVPVGYHIKVAMFYFAVGVVVILLKGIVTERITMLMARRQGVEL